VFALRYAVAMPEIISRADAKAAGLKRYFTGKPCPRGHIAERYVNSKGCRECGRILGQLSDTKAYYHATRIERLIDGGKYKAKDRGHAALDPATLRPYPADSRCDKCMKVAKLCIDHDHVTGQFRGWLCQNCNRGIGMLDDNRDGLLEAVDYLDGKLPWQ